MMTVAPVGVEDLYQTVCTRYGRMTLFANDTGAVSRSLLAYGEWAENELSFLRMMLSPGATVLDVGAYIGTHTLAFSKFVGPHGRVIAIEPQDKTFELLMANVRANRLPNVRLERAAASDQETAVEIWPIDPSRQGSFGSASLCDSVDNREAAGQVSENPVSIRAFTLDSLALPSCDLIKIDAEGFETLVIRGAERTIRRFSPAIYAECNSLENGLRILALIREFGYAVRLHVVDAFNPDNFLHNDENIFGPARELALLGVSGRFLDGIHGARSRECELLLEIETADDLALGMLNKPQYPQEIMSTGAAARTGGNGWIDQLVQLRTDHERIGNEVTWAKGELETARAETARARQDADTSRAYAEACMAQARIARECADRAEAAVAKIARRSERIAKDLAATSGELGRVKDDAARAEAKVAELAQQNEHASSQLAGAQTEYDRLRAEYDRLRAERDRLRLIELSTTWRVTAPLRAAVGRLSHSVRRKH